MRLIQELDKIVRDIISMMPTEDHSNTKLSIINRETLFRLSLVNKESSNCERLLDQLIELRNGNSKQIVRSINQVLKEINIQSEIMNNILNTFDQ